MSFLDSIESAFMRATWIDQIPTFIGSLIPVGCSSPKPMQQGSIPPPPPPSDEANSPDYGTSIYAPPASHRTSSEEANSPAHDSSSINSSYESASRICPAFMARAASWDPEQSLSARNACQMYTEKINVLTYLNEPAEALLRKNCEDKMKELHGGSSTITTANEKLIQDCPEAVQQLQEMIDVPFVKEVMTLTPNDDGTTSAQLDRAFLYYDPKATLACLQDPSLKSIQELYQCLYR